MTNINKLLSADFDMTLNEFKKEQDRISCLEFSKTFPATLAKLTKTLLDELDECSIKKLIKTRYGVNSLVLTRKDNDNELVSKWVSAVSNEISSFYTRINFMENCRSNKLINTWSNEFPAYLLNAKDINDEFSKALNTPVTVLIDDLTVGHITLRICKA